MLFGENTDILERIIHIHIRIHPGIKLFMRANKITEQSTQQTICFYRKLIK